MRETKRERERERETERKERETERDRKKEREREREGEREKERKRERKRETDRETVRQRDRHTQRQRVLASTFKVLKSQPAFKVKTSFNFFRIKFTYLCIPYNVCYGVDLSLNRGCLTQREGG